ncbi:MAG: hypothetical protein N4A32_03695 [Marinifilaceae bacterium]|jgi:hypothetical protein|nr:hypothetical protein [Marinifilaceae bacterium]
MNTNCNPKINTYNHDKRFATYLEKENSKRIIFSAPFGMGKTQFLQNFFANNTADYECFHLFPINYQVAANEDIFDIFKFDLIQHLVAKNLIKSDDKLSKSLIAQSYMINEGGNIVWRILKQFTKIGSPILGQGVESVENNLNFLNNIKKYQRKINNLKIDKVINFINEVVGNNKLVYGFDFMGRLISESIESIEGKQSVLILDDLDRIDPGHIFRILNVFSAHFDKTIGDEDINKYGFDKIILVCDFNNIKNIFEYLYGPKTDFNGYINKYMSCPYYEFWIFNEVIRYILDNISDDDLKQIPNILLTIFKKHLVLIDSNSYYLTLRDISSFLNNKFQDIYVCKIQRIYNGRKYIISTDAPLTRFLSYMKILHLEYWDFIGDLKSEFSLEVFNLIGVFWLLNENLEKTLFDYNMLNPMFEHTKNSEIKFNKITENQFIEMKNLNIVNSELIESIVIKVSLIYSNCFSNETVI